VVLGQGGSSGGLYGRSPIVYVALFVMVVSLHCGSVGGYCVVFVVVVLESFGGVSL